MRSGSAAQPFEAALGICSAMRAAVTASASVSGEETGAASTARRRRPREVAGVLEEDPDPRARRRRVRSRVFREQYPLAALLAEYDRARQGALIFHPRHVYDAYRSGERRHHWLQSIRFRV